LPTRGDVYTWSNGRKGGHNIQKKLDRAIVNHDGIGASSLVSVTTLTKMRSDHFPILLEFTNHDIQISSRFKFMTMWISHLECVNVFFFRDSLIYEMKISIVILFTDDNALLSNEMRLMFFSI
jgi:hypothetical protein